MAPEAVSEAMRPTLRQQAAYFVQKKRGSLTQLQFARRVGISDSTVCRLEAGKDNFSEETLTLICRAFNCSLQDIFPDEFTKTNSDRTGLKLIPAQKPVWTPYREPEEPTIRPVMAFLGFISAQIGLFCRQIRDIPAGNKVIAS